MSTNQTNSRATKSTAHAKVVASNSTGNNRAHGSKMQTKKNLPEWDTDFDGAWEMGRDLIREFVMKQNNRNRSISESDAGKFMSLDQDTYNRLNCANENDQVDMGNHELSVKDFDAKNDENGSIGNDDEADLMRVAAAATSALFGKNNFDMAGSMNAYTNALNVPDSGTLSSTSTVMDSGLLMLINDKAIVRSEGYSTPDTLSSWNEIALSCDLKNRRLYEREVSNESINCAGLTKACINDIETSSDCVDSGCDENNYLAAFEAKFDHSVEALWNDCKQEETFTTVSNAEIQPLNSFWFDYYRNNVDTQPSQGSAYSADKLNEFPSINQPVAFLMQNMHGKNPFSAAQPNSLNSNESSVGGMGLTTSIWSDNPNNSEDDVSFYANAKLWEKKYAKQAAQSLNVSSYFDLSFFHRNEN